MRKKAKAKLGKTLRNFDFTRNILFYRSYFFLSTKNFLKKSVAGSYLSWLWLIFEPIFLTILYGVVISLLMRGNGLSFGVFVLAGIMTMKFFEKGVMRSLKLIKNKNSLIINIHIPKNILLVEVICNSLPNFLISFCLMFILMIIAKVKFTIYLLHFPVIFILLLIITFAFSLFALHLGYLIPDLEKTMKMIFRLLFYASGVIFPIEQIVHNKLYLNLLHIGNPIAFVMNQFREVLLNANTPDYRFIAVWYVIGLVMIFFGLKLISKNERVYGKHE